MYMNRFFWGVRFSSDFYMLLNSSFYKIKLQYKSKLCYSIFCSLLNMHSWCLLIVGWSDQSSQIYLTNIFLAHKYFITTNTQGVTQQESALLMGCIHLSSSNQTQDSGLFNNSDELESS